MENHSSSVLPHRARPVTDEEEEDDDGKIRNLRATKFCSCGETEVRISPSDVALATDRPLNVGSVFLRLS